jgi:hypothetical protein
MRDGLFGACQAAWLLGLDGAEAGLERAQIFANEWYHIRIK